MSSTLRLRAMSRRAFGAVVNDIVPDVVHAHRPKHSGGIVGGPRRSETCPTFLLSRVLSNRHTRWHALFSPRCCLIWFEWPPPPDKSAIEYKISRPNYIIVWFCVFNVLCRCRNVSGLSVTFDNSARDLSLVVPNGKKTRVVIFFFLLICVLSPKSFIIYAPDQPSTQSPPSWIYNFQNII